MDKHRPNEFSPVHIEDLARAQSDFERHDKTDDEVKEADCRHAKHRPQQQRGIRYAAAKKCRYSRAVRSSYTPKKSGM